MNKVIVLFLSIYLLAIPNAKAQKIATPTFVDTLLIKTDSLNLALIILNLQDIAPQIKGWDIYSTYDSTDGTFGNNNQFTSKQYENIFSSFSDLDKYESSEKKYRVHKEIDKWIQFQNVLNDMPVNDSISFPEIFYKIKSLKSVFLKYIHNSQKQYWGSLTESQITKLYFDCLNYIVRLDNKQYIIFHKEFYETMLMLLY